MAQHGEPYIVSYIPSYSMSSFGFEISNSKGLLEALLIDRNELSKDPLSSRIAINCVFKAWHLVEWVFHEFPVPKLELKKHRETLIDQCPSLQIMNDLADGNKHYKLTRHHNFNRTSVEDGDFDPADFSAEDFNVSRLVVLKKDGSTVYFEQELDKSISFWRGYIQAHYP